MLYKTVLHSFSILVFFTLTACSATSDTTRFYTLKPVDNLTETHYTVTNKQSISIESLAIPRLLDRPQIISRIGANEINRSEFHQWGGSVLDEIKQLIASSLDQGLLDTNYYIQSGDSRLPSEYSLYINIKRFDGLLGNKASIELHWLLESQDLRFSTHGLVKLSEPLVGRGYDEYVSSLQTLLVKSSESVSEQLLHAMLNK